MPRYFFHIVHQPDTEGSELPDIYSAQAEAVCLCGEMIRELDGNFWAEPLWQLRVTDNDQLLLFTLTFSAQEQAQLH